MKKFVCVILALALALIAGCSSGETSAPDNSPAAAVPSPVETYDLPEASPPVPVPFSRLDTPEPTASPVSAQAEPATESGEHSYPDDYPELGGELTVTGRYETYERDGLTYCHLVDAELSY